MMKVYKVKFERGWIQARYSGNIIRPSQMLVKGNLLFFGVYDSLYLLGIIDSLEYYKDVGLDFREPRINVYGGGYYTVENAIRDGILEDVTLVWNRDKMLRELGI